MTLKNTWNVHEINLHLRFNWGWCNPVLVLRYIANKKKLQLNFRRKWKVKGTSNRWIRLPAVLWRSMGQDFVVVWLAGRTGWYPCWDSYRFINASNSWAIRYCHDSNRIVGLNYNIMARCTIYNIMWLVTGQWFSPCTLVSCNNKTDCHGITEILLKVALNTINQPITRNVYEPCIIS